MVRVRKVAGLEHLALVAYRELVVDMAGKIEEAVRGKQMGLGMEQEVGGGGNWHGRLLICSQVMRRVSVFVKEVQDYVWPSVVCYLTQQVGSIR